MEHSSSALEGFPPLIQTFFYIGTLVVSLGVASHGYFKGWLKKVTPAKDVIAAEGGKQIETAIVLDRAEMRALSDSLNRTDATMRSCQDDMRRTQDGIDKLIEIGEELIATIKGRT